MTRRKLLASSVAALASVAAALAAIPFVRSLGMSAEAENRSWGTYDLGDMSPGELRKFTRTWVYRRTDQDKASLSLFVDALADPNSVESHQPANAKNTWRSEKADFFVFLPYAPIRRCAVAFVPAGAAIDDDQAETRIIKTIPHFREPCEGRTFDVAGRLFSRPNYPPEQNLPVPEVQWLSETRVLIKGS